MLCECLAAVPGPLKNENKRMKAFPLHWRYAFVPFLYRKWKRIMGWLRALVVFFFSYTHQNVCIAARKCRSFAPIRRDPRALRSTDRPRASVDVCRCIRGFRRRNVFAQNCFSLVVWIPNEGSTSATPDCLLGTPASCLCAVVRR